ncbi:hypothetical protein MKQ70_14955 [Chitinophaga sedimenti]|uniref:hypothetical protein n=1 Tax=Chitinophaga sedimenti TaxID=2033606 RepID=UPI002002C8F6|nr:hypothetical protein [Chitinophaga sedimenti]MCK7556243.1 hypothetical protein [Chitinophaga sedimenti]
MERLFGNDVGDASHYLKKISVDPNKQIAISYENVSGKTIATALAGKSPDNVDELPSAGTPVERTYPVLKPDNMVFDRTTLTLRGYTTYVNTMVGEAQLGYEVQRLIKQYEENGVSICSNCYYALKIELHDDCGEKKGTWVMPVTIGSATGDCSVNGKQSAELDFTFDKIGAHYITFELAMDPNVIENYTEDYIKRNTNLRTEFNFIVEALKDNDYSGCFTECETCLTALGSREHFVERLNDQLARYNVDVSKMGKDYESWANGLYVSLLSQCRAAQANCATSPCDELKSLMLKDVSPGGQYALFTTDLEPMEPGINILYKNWRTRFTSADQLTLADGRVTSPADPTFTLDMLIQYWKPEWAEKFVNLHPEYCAYTSCINTASFRIWDTKIKDIYNSVADISKITPGLLYDRNNPTWLLAVDPFFAEGAPGYPYLSSFINDLRLYSTRILNMPSNAEVKSISKYVDYSLYCAAGGI